MARAAGSRSDGPSTAISANSPGSAEPGCGSMAAGRPGRPATTAGADEQLNLFATLERKPDEPGTERLRQVEPRRPWFRIGRRGRRSTGSRIRGPMARADLLPRSGLATRRPPLGQRHGRRGPCQADPPSLVARRRVPGRPGPRFPLNPPGDPGVLPRSLEVEDGKVSDDRITGRGGPSRRGPARSAGPGPALPGHQAGVPRGSSLHRRPGPLAGLEIAGYEHRLYSAPASTLASSGR